MPPGVWTTASISLPVLTLWMRTVVSGAEAGDHPGLDRERPDAGQHVAAVGRRVDRWLQHAGLGEQIVDVRVRSCRAADDGDLGGQRVAAADAVDLQLVPGAHDARKHSIARHRITRQIFTTEIRSARSTATHHARMVLMSYWDSVSLADVPGDAIASRTGGDLTRTVGDVKCNDLNERCMAHMKLDLDDLRGFVAIAELGSFHAAADALHLSQPALTRRLQKLEATLGVQLIDRDSRQLRLSSVGRDFFFKAKRLLDELDAAVLGIRELADQASGEVTIGAVPTATYYFLPRVIEDFNTQYPRIRIRILDLSANDVLEAVQRGQAEFGINLLGAQEPDIDFEPLLRDPFLFVCRNDHAAGDTRAGPLGGNRALPVHHGRPAQRQPDDHGRGLADLPVRPRWFYEVQHLSTSLGLVEAGLGVAAVPKLAAPSGAARCPCRAAAGRSSGDAHHGDHPPARLHPVAGGPAVPSDPQGSLGDGLAPALLLLADGTLEDRLDEQHAWPGRASPRSRPRRVGPSTSGTGKLTKRRSFAP